MKKIILLTIPLIALIFMSGCVEDRSIEEKPMINVIQPDWYINTYNENELILTYYIVNYGDVEARDIKVRCKSEDDSENVLYSYIHNYGNLASHSIEYSEFIVDSIYFPDSDHYYLFCYVESCNNCDILYKRIPELVDSYEGELE